MESVRRPCVIVGNWKMHKTIEEARTFVNNLIPSLKSSSKNSVGLAVPFTMILPLSQAAEGTPLWIGAQNMNDSSEGAFTGEIAGSMVLDAGAQFVILGHSERRHIFHEDDAFINRKIIRAVEVGLRPILCVGETQQEFEAGQTHEVIERQLREGLKGLKTTKLKKLIIAYEPVWAIGSRHSATPEIAQEVQAFCRQTLASLLTEKFAEKVVIQYGGSVNPLNAQKLLDQPDIDGLLIGGASLSLESFMQIVDDSQKSNRKGKTT